MEISTLGRINLIPGPDTESWEAVPGRLFLSVTDAPSLIPGSQCPTMNIGSGFLFRIRALTAVVNFALRNTRSGHRAFSFVSGTVT